MKSLSLPSDEDITIGGYGPACEGFVDLLKSLFGGKKKKGPFDENLAAVKGTKGYGVLTGKLEDDLRLTYDNPEWVAKNLGDASGLIHVSALTLANVDGKSITSPSELLKAAQDMLKVVNDVARSEKPFIDLRRDLVNKISQKKDNAYADQMWVEHAKELTPSAADRFLQRYKGRHFPALANSPEKDGEWPVSDKKKWNHVFNNAYRHFKTDGMFEAPSAKNAKAYATAIRGLVAMLLELNKLADQTRIPYWEFLEVEYDELKNANEIYDRIATADGWYEVSDLASGLADTCYILALGLYIAMFDKHMVAKTPANEGWVDRVKNVFSGRKQEPVKYDGAKALAKVKDFLANPDRYTLTGASFKASDKLYLSVDGKPPVLSHLGQVYWKTVSEALAQNKLFMKDIVINARLCKPLIDRFEKTMIDNMDKQGNVDQEILDKAMLPLIAATPKANDSYFHKFAATGNDDCKHWLGGNPFKFVQVNPSIRSSTGWRYEYTELEPIDVPALRDIETATKIADAFLSFSDEKYPWFKDGTFEDDEDNWVDYEFDRPVRHLWEYMNEEQMRAINAIYSYDENSASAYGTVNYSMGKVYSSLLKYLDASLVRNKA